MTTVLLDENFPLQLYDHLRRGGVSVEHILLQDRGAPDARIRARLSAESDLLFLTQDTEFLEFAREYRSAVVVSHVPQALPVAMRVAQRARAQ